MAYSDEAVLGYLGRALSLELSAVQQYSTQAQLVATWGLNEAASSLRNEANEELQHANRIIERMLSLNVAPNASQLRPVRLGGDLSEILRVNQELEADIIQLYYAATLHCAKVGDSESRDFFQELLKEEQLHHAELEAWLKRLQQIAL